MKLLVFIALIFISSLAFAQETSQKEFRLKSSYKNEIKDFRKPLPTAFIINYERDTAIKPYTSLSPMMVFKHSATIYDMTKIILFNDGTFYCYTYGCLREGSSAGNYTITNDTLMLTSSNKIFNKLKINSTIQRNNFVFVELKDLRFLINNEELIGIKQSSF